MKQLTKLCNITDRTIIFLGDQTESNIYLTIHEIASHGNLRFPISNRTFNITLQYHKRKQVNFHSENLTVKPIGPACSVLASKLGSIIGSNTKAWKGTVSNSPVNYGKSKLHKSSTKSYGNYSYRNHHKNLQPKLYNHL